MGFHGLESGQFTAPALTSIAHPRPELGDMGATRLIERIADPNGILPVGLLIGESCGANLQ